MAARSRATAVPARPVRDQPATRAGTVAPSPAIGATRDRRTAPDASRRLPPPRGVLCAGGSITADDPLDSGDRRRPQPCRGESMPARISWTRPPLPRARASQARKQASVASASIAIASSAPACSATASCAAAPGSRDRASPARDSSRSGQRSVRRRLPSGRCPPRSHETRRAAPGLLAGACVPRRLGRAHKQSRATPAPVGQACRALERCGGACVATALEAVAAGVLERDGRDLVAAHRGGSEMPRATIELAVGQHRSQRAVRLPPGADRGVAVDGGADQRVLELDAPATTVTRPAASACEQRPMSTPIRRAARPSSCRSPLSLVAASSRDLRASSSSAAARRR